MSGTNEFEALILSELSKAWHRQVFAFEWNKSGITAPAFILHDSKNLGVWYGDKRTISIQRKLATKGSWGGVIEILRHEMAHQYVNEVLHVDNETPHGKTFQSVCKKHGIDATAAGDPKDDNIDAPHHIVEKVKRLLKLAEDNSNPNEKEVAAAQAHRLMLKHNIERMEEAEETGYTVQYFGEITGRIQAYMSQIAALISEFYFVEVIWMSITDPRTHKEGHQMEVSGKADNVEAAEYVHSFLNGAAIAAWECKMNDPDFKDQIRQELYSNYTRPGAPTTEKGYVIAARKNFLCGFVAGFASQLEKEDAKEKSEGLVLAKDIDLETFYHNRHPHIRKLKSQRTYYNAEIRNEGYQQGKNLRMPTTTKPNKQFIPLLGK